MKKQKCSKCKEIKDQDQYYKCRTNKIGYSYWCKACHSAYQRGWYQTPQGKHSQAMRTQSWYLSDKRRVNR